MPAKPSLIISLPEPCGEDWNAMKPTGCGRFCNACQKIVVDFTMMTDAEILAILRNSDTPPCGRFLPAQLDRTLTETPQSKRIPFVPKIAAALLALQAFTIHSFAQGKKNAPVTTHDPQPAHNHPARTVKGALLVGSNQPLAGAALILTADGYDPLYAVSDEQGCFSFTLPDSFLPAQAQLSLTKAYSIDHQYMVDETILLAAATFHSERTVYAIIPEILPAVKIETDAPYAHGGGSLGGAPCYKIIKKPTLLQRMTKPFTKHSRR